MFAEELADNDLARASNTIRHQGEALPTMPGLYDRPRLNWHTAKWLSNLINHYSTHREHTAWYVDQSNGGVRVIRLDPPPLVKRGRKRSCKAVTP